MTALPKGIYKRRNSYYVRWKQAGMWKHMSAGPDLGRALELQAQLRGSEDPPDAVRLAELVERYLKRLATDVAAPTGHDGVRFAPGGTVDD